MELVIAFAQLFFLITGAVAFSVFVIKNVRKD